ncbi:glycosyl-phosphatidylinositol-anchored molecule-like protein [Meriones unguiculatus]|uniref:glycosyl-phosphatidylinositol-anchored molecule-like protein n=1 Tax=Meriones unguiculatus TaxID=10047 RepID=UPI000B4E9E47|nr:glycosyl-phosphatidylinositol-anchored molecule-like protein [Meriones unguiculatus]
MMLPFFLLILLGLPCVDATDNNTSGLENSVDADPEPRWKPTLQCKTCSTINTFVCHAHKLCPDGQRRCATVAVRVNSRELMVYKDCIRDCTFVYKVHQPAAVGGGRRLPGTNSFYYVYCCAGNDCNIVGPSNIERDLIGDKVIEETIIARAVCLGEFNLLPSLALLLSSSLMT